MARRLRVALVTLAVGAVVALLILTEPRQPAEQHYRPYTHRELVEEANATRVYLNGGGP
jgi:hypothetical protein